MYIGYIEKTYALEKGKSLIDQKDVSSWPVIGYSALFEKYYNII